jgi:signal transduction histidine kinase
MMAALGGLVAGVSHEISNPVGIGVTAASYLQQQSQEIKHLYDEGKMTRSDLESYLKKAAESSEIILGNLSRASELIQGFKQVAVDQASGDQRTFNLKDYIDETLLSLHPELKKTEHTVIVHCPADLEIRSFPGAFSQIITNLVLNSLMHGFERKKRGEILLDVSGEHGMLWMRYSDNGKGMTPEEHARIFDPFYTTKRGQGGSGLGLHIVYNLVTQQLHGTIECESSPERGATFIIKIPMNKQDS